MRFEDIRIGQKAWTYSTWGRVKAEVMAIRDEDTIVVENEFDGDTFEVHPRQLARIKKKQPVRFGRVWWVNESAWNLAAPSNSPAGSSWADWFEKEGGYYISITKPQDPTGWIEIREILK